MSEMSPKRYAAMQRKAARRRIGEAVQRIHELRSAAAALTPEQQEQGLAALLAFGCDCGGDHITVGGRRFASGEALAWAQLHTAHAFGRALSAEALH